MGAAPPTSFSCGYCESHSRLAPRSTMPICTSKRCDGASAAVPHAYSSATLRSAVADKNAISTPPRTPCWFAFQKCSGSSPPETPL